MKLDNCTKCEFHNDYIKGQILCTYHRNVSSMATYEDKKSGTIYVIGCPMDT